MVRSSFLTAVSQSVLLATVLLLAVGFLSAEHWPTAGAAFAQDDDSDDDGPDDDGGDDDDAGGNDPAGDTAVDRPARDPARARDRALPRAEARRSSGGQVPGNAPAVRREVFAPGEIVVTNLGDSDLAVLQAEGFVLIERVDLTNVAVALHRLQVPGGLTLEQARDRVRAQPTGGTGDFNHFYRSEQQDQKTDVISDASVAGVAAPPAPDLASAQPIAATPPCTHLNCAALALIDWPPARETMPLCRVTVPIGVVDTGVNAAHENLFGANLEVLQLVSEKIDASKAIHGTAVAALLVGQSDDRAPGLIPEAQVIAVDIFGRDGADERASVVSLVRALDLLARRGVKVINMSLAGPQNAILEAALTEIAKPGGALLLAAAGNGGPTAETAYPAGFPTVMAVTAVDQRGQVYRLAQRGAHLDLAAPGVDIWSATSIRGVKPKTGTSFAVPFVTAAAAVLASRNPQATPDGLAAHLRTLARDVGAEGPDVIFGAGLLSLENLCKSEIFVPAVE